MDSKLIKNKPASFGRLVLIVMFVFVALFGSIHTLKSEDISTDSQKGAHNTSKDVIVDGLTQAERAAQIDNFFAKRGSPLVGYGMKFVQEADKYNGAIDWRLAVGIATMETNAGLMLCKNPAGAYNLFGFGSCKIAFKSFDESIEVVTQHLAGMHPNTDHIYSGLDTVDILNKYNPPSIRADYVQLVTYVMRKVSEQPTVRVSNHLAVK